MTDPDSLRALLAWMGLPGVGERTLAALLKHARTARQPLANLWRSADADLAALVRLPAAALTALAERRDECWAAAEALAEALTGWGIEALTGDDPGFSPRLRAAAGAGRLEWPVLFACGALDVLEEPLVAVVNSRHASAAALERTDRLADALARRDLALISGHNREAYQTVAIAGKRHGAASALVLDRGLLAAFPGGPGLEPVPGARVWEETLDPATQVLLSPFAPRAEWTPRNGPRRDALLFDLAACVVAVAVRPGGHMERECLRAARRGMPVFALEGAEGASPLWEQDAAVRRADPNLEQLVETIAAALPGRALDIDREAERLASLRRDLRRFLPAAARALSPGETPRAARVFPQRGPLRAALRETPLAAALERGDAGGPADLLLGEFGTLDLVAVPAAGLRPGGLLVAVLPAAALQSPRAGPTWEPLLAAGALLAVVEHPPAGEAVIAYRRGPASGPARPVLRLSPAPGAGERHAARRYLLQALGQLAARGAEEETGAAAEA